MFCMDCASGLRFVHSEQSDEESLYQFWREKTPRSPPQKRARERFSFDKKVDVIGPGAESSAAHVLVTAVVCLTEI